MIEESEVSLVKSFVQLLFDISSTCIDDNSRILVDRLSKVCASHLKLSLEELKSSFLDRGYEVVIQVGQIEQEVSIVNKQYEQVLPIVQIQQAYVKSEDIDLVSNL